MLRASRPLRWTPILAACGVALGLATSAPAQVLPLGDDFQVNTYTTDRQYFPQVTVAPDGAFIVLWCCGEQAGARALVGRRFDALGQPLGDEFAVNQSESPTPPSSVAADSDGNFVVVWGSGSGGCPGCHSDYVKARRFTAAGQARGPQFAVSEPPGGFYTGDGSVASHTDGSFEVAWYDYGTFARRYDANGDPIGEVFAIPGDTTDADSPNVAAQPDGGFVVVWRESSGSPWEYFLRGLLYDADGLPVGDIFPVAGAEWGFRGTDLAARSDGSFVVAWSPLGSSYILNVEARLFATDGTLVTAPFLVSALPTTYSFPGPAIGSEVDGGFLVAWTSLVSSGSDDSTHSIQARRFAPDGTPLGGQFQVNSYTTGSQFRPQIGVQPNGDFVVVWVSIGSSGSDTSSMSVQARRLRPPFFNDGFESGDFTRWSAASPVRTSGRSSGGGT